MENLAMFLVNEEEIHVNNVVAAVAVVVEDLLEPLEGPEEERRMIPKNENFYEVTIPLYMDDLFREHFRMSRRAVGELTGIIGNQVPQLRTAKVELEKKVLFTIWVISKPESFLAASDRFGIARSTGHYSFRQIIDVLVQIRGQFITWPLNYEEVERKFFQNTRFPGIVGAVDGCHISIKQPSNNANDYYNRHGQHSIILQGICDHRMKFTDIFVGVPGRVHDARVFRNSPVYNAIHAMPGNLHVLGDSAYPLSVNLMCPFRDNGHLNAEKINFNTRLSSARSIIERAFGRLKGKFRRLKYLDICTPNFGNSIITAACVLHNFIIEFDGHDDEEFENEVEPNAEADGIDEELHANAAVQKRQLLAIGLLE